MPPYFEDFKDFIRLLQKHEVEYMIVGAYAVAIYSRPRFTQDLDFWVSSSKENAAKLIKVVNEFGDALGLSEDDFMTEGKIIQFGVAPIRIDIITSIEGVNFLEAYKNKKTYTFDDIDNVNYISLDDLIKNKKSVGRKKDIDDIHWIKKWKK